MLGLKKTCQLFVLHKVAVVVPANGVVGQVAKQGLVNWGGHCRLKWVQCKATLWLAEEVDCNVLCHFGGGTKIWWAQSLTHWD